jgi:hypothetical protein
LRRFDFALTANQFRISALRAERASLGMDGAKPTITSHRTNGKIMDSWSDLTLSTVAPGEIAGGTPFRQPCPACHSTQGWKISQVRFSEESFRSDIKPETRSQKAYRKFSHATAKTHSTQQA